MIYRIFIEETASRLFYRDVDAASPAEANALAATAIDSEAWLDWAESETSAHLEVSPRLTETVDADGRATRMERGDH